MGKRGKNRKRAFPAVCIAAGFLLLCAAGFAVVDAGMRSELYRDPAPAFAAVLEEGELSVWLLGRQTHIELPSLREALGALAEQLYAQRQALPAPADISYFTKPHSL